MSAHPRDERRARRQILGSRTQRRARTKLPYEGRTAKRQPTPAWQMRYGIAREVPT